MKLIKSLPLLMSMLLIVAHASETPAIKVKKEKDPKREEVARKAIEDVIKHGGQIDRKTFDALNKHDRQYFALTMAHDTLKEVKEVKELLQKQK